MRGDEASLGSDDIFADEEDELEGNDIEGFDQNDYKPFQHQRKQSLLQRLGKSMAQINGTPSQPTTVRGAQKPMSVNLVKSETYLNLEEEYTRLKFEQTELVALADQRKLQKGKSIKLLQALEQELKDRKQENEDLRQKKLDRENEIEEEKINPSKPRAHRPPSLQSMLLERDLAQHHFNRVVEDLAALRETTAELLEQQDICPAKHQDTEQIESSFKRIYLEDSIEEIQSEISKIKQQLNDITSKNHTETLTTNTDTQSTASSVISFSKRKSGRQLAEEALDRMRKAEEWAILRANLRGGPDANGWIPAVQPADYDAELFGVRDALDLMLSDADVPPWARGRETVMPKNADYSIPVVREEKEEVGDATNLDKKARSRRGSAVPSFGPVKRTSCGHGTLQFGLSGDLRSSVFQ